MSFFKKLFLGSIALGFILIGGSGTQSSNMFLQGGGFIGLIIGLVALYIFTKMAWRAMGCLPSFIVIMSIVCFIVYAIGGFNNGLGGVIENLQTFIGGSHTSVATPQIMPEEKQNTLKLDENFNSEKIQSEQQQKEQSQPQQKAQEQGGLIGFLNTLTGKTESRQPDIMSLPSFSSQVSVVTADTLNAQGRYIKLYGIAAPSITQTCANRRGESYYCGKQAALWLQSWLTTNPVTCRVMSEKNGKMLAVCNLGQYDIGAALVNAGWAVADTRETEIYVPYEQNAQNNRDGLWQGKFYKPWDWEAIQHRKPQYKVIKPKDPNRRSFFK
ncbi:MAG: thermonuclease family protein [Alphaproteobacteria bacterium]|nr:thermonuclease family protein [Alphaproteobacteria bacterium]